MSEYGRVLEQRDGYLYDCGRYLYAFLPFLQYVDWQAAPVGPEGACEWHQVLDEALLAELPPDCLLIELASASGFDMDAVETLRLSYLKAGGLPGRVAPETAARAIKKTLCRLIKEEA